MTKGLSLNSMVERSGADINILAALSLEVVLGIDVIWQFLS